MTFPGRSSPTYPGRPLTLTVAAIGLALVMTVLSERSMTPEPALGGENPEVPEEEPPPTASTAAPAAAQDEDQPTLRVRVQMPSTLQAGGGRQFRISADSGPSRSNDDRDPLVRVQLLVSQPGSLAGSVVVTPDAMILRRSELRQTRFELHVLSHVGCDAPAGSLQVRVTEITESRPTGEATLELPPVTCQTPPDAPDSVHDTTPECGDGLELQEWLLDTEDPPADEVCQEPGAAPQPTEGPGHQEPEPADEPMDTEEDADLDDPAAEEDAEDGQDGQDAEDAEDGEQTDQQADEQPSSEDGEPSEDGDATDDAPDDQDPPADDPPSDDETPQETEEDVSGTGHAQEDDLAEQGSEG